LNLIAVFVALALLAMCGYCVVAWLPTALIRAYGVTAGQVGKVLGVSTILMNSTGMLLAGILCDRLTRLGKRDAPIIVALILRTLGFSMRQTAS